MTERDDQGRKRARFAPWLLLGPGMLFLFLFFFFPLYTLGRMSLSYRPSRFANPVFGWDWSNFSNAFSQYGSQFTRSFVYAALATLLALVIGYPLAYVIAFRGGRFKNILLGLVVVPFFTNFLIRTWRGRRSSATRGWSSGFLRDVGILGPTGTLLRTPIAVIGGLTYNFLPFMVLPIYVALEKIDPRLVDAARDLYSNTWRAFRKVIVPALVARRVRREPSRLHPGGRRLRQRVLPRQREDLDDRQRRAGPVPGADRTTRLPPRSRSCSWPS